MEEPTISLSKLRRQAEARGRFNNATVSYADWGEVLALITVAETARETCAIFDRLNDRTRGVAPSHDIGPEYGQLQTANAQLRDALARFTP